MKSHKTSCYTHFFQQSSQSTPTCNNSSRSICMSIVEGESGASRRWKHGRDNAVSTSISLRRVRAPVPWTGIPPSQVPCRKLQLQKLQLWPHRANNASKLHHGERDQQPLWRRKACQRHSRQVGRLWYVTLFCNPICRTHLEAPSCARSRARQPPRTASMFMMPWSGTVA